MEKPENPSFSTRLRLRRRSKFANDRLIFGRPITLVRLDKNTETLSFHTSQIFGFVRWRADGFGTQTWRFVVAQAGAPSEKITRITAVKPGAHLLLHAFGKTRAKRVLRAIDMLSDSAVLHDIAPAYWRHMHLHISKNLPFEPYDPEAFAALDRAKLVK